MDLVNDRQRLRRAVRSFRSLAAKAQRFVAGTKRLMARLLQ
jgi:hypothetical protein